MKTDSTCHAFYGKCRSGGTAFSHCFAQLINCENATTDDSCGVCHSCRMYAKLSHPDLHFALPVNAIDDIKNLKQMILLNSGVQHTKNPNLSLQDWYDTIGIEKNKE